MTLNSGGSGLSALTTIRRFMQPRVRRERCDLCDAQIGADHDHLVEVSSRRLHCACQACAVLFGNQSGVKYRRVPRRAQYLADFQLTDAHWAGLQLPINLAFFLYNTPVERVVILYPSPAGATESLLTPEAWQTLVEDNPILRELGPDVEALLVNRLGKTAECYRVGIDKCYELVGLIRSHWRGLSGGTAVWEEIGRFFTDLKERSRPKGDTAHA